MNKKSAFTVTAQSRKNVDSEMENSGINVMHVAASLLGGKG